MQRSTLMQPQQYSDMLLFRVNRLRAVGGGLVLRYCEACFGITRREWVMVALLANAAPVSASELATLSRMDRSGTSKALASLLRKGLVEKRHGPSDRRFVEVLLTEAGRDLYEQILPVVNNINQEILAELSADEVTQLDDFLARMQHAAEKLCASLKDVPRVDRGHGGTRHKHGGATSFDAFDL